MDVTFDRSGRAVLLGTKSVIGAGLNLVEANCIVEMEPSLTKSEEEQCVGRLHRTTQTRQVDHYILSTNGTVDFKLFEHAHIRQAVVRGRVGTGRNTLSDIEILRGKDDGRMIM